ncbi:hypothetical protein [Streptomyces sp. McG3]|uniref:hypothetical protein n=1 Tax=Streptomyces sp. McG3 TaxID=2725483 RepID=UPI001BE59082|nr:hypothetical protein [Streptomyces sp. McG3]MBT2896842.1 hypothetical protein [Streptomyces sp. McG3]
MAQSTIERPGSGRQLPGQFPPESPGITELADLLRAARRLGGLLPAVTLWHLQRAIDQEHAAHQQQ